MKKDLLKERMQSAFGYQDNQLIEEFERIRHEMEGSKEDGDRHKEGNQSENS